MRSIFANQSRKRPLMPQTSAPQPDMPDTLRPPPRPAAIVRDDILTHAITPERALELAQALTADGRILEAIESLTEANRLRRSAAVERRLVRLRRAAFAQLDRSLPPPPWPPSVPEDARDVSAGPLIVTPGELTAGVLCSGLQRHGCVLVRGLVSPSRAARLRAAIERTFDAYDEDQAGRRTAETAAWFDPLENVADGAELRRFARAAQSVLAADSPRTLYEFLETLYEARLDRVIGAYFGERPTLDVKKCVLRRVDWTCQHSLWHQDGAFLGAGIRTVNAWFALTPCGRDAPGMDVIALREPRLLSAGEEGAGFHWAVAPDTIVRELPEAQPWRPEFEAGDVLLFDHYLLHRTAAAPGMTALRFAIESWFFASSVYPVDTSIPLVV